MLVLSLLPLLLVEAGFAIPSHRAPIPASALTLPPDQTQLVAPIDLPSFVTLAVGFQNFTCSTQTGNWM